jgi:hypothetical protein
LKGELGLADGMILHSRIHCLMKPVDSAIRHGLIHV